MEHIIKQLEAHEKWLEGLTDLDRMNFFTLLGLPNAAYLVNDMEDGEYKTRAIFQLALNKFREQHEQSED